MSDNSKVKCFSSFQFLPWSNFDIVYLAFVVGLLESVEASFVGVEASLLGST